MWSFSGENLKWDGLPMPSLYGEKQIGNAATALMALIQLDDNLAVTRESVDQGLINTSLPGRFQRIPGSL